MKNSSLNDQLRTSNSSANDAQSSSFGCEFRSGSVTGTALISGPTFSLKPLRYAEVDGLAIYEGDIVLGTIEQVRKQMDTAGDPLALVARTGQHFRWPGAIIPFEIDPAMPDQGRITAAIAHWEANTRIRFVQRTAVNVTQFPDFVRFRPGDACRSPVGCQRSGRQDITLDIDCSRGNVIHEIGHAVGLWHEQSREDRDAFIRIEDDNIEKEKLHNFDQHVSDGDDIGGYDYGSIMHYPPDAFSVNGQPTIVPKQPLPPGVVMGQRTALSQGDIKGVEAMYRPQRFELSPWVTREFSKTWTHVIKGSFVDPQLETRGMTDLFCYDRNKGIGAFFAMVKNGRLDDGTPVPDGPEQIGINHTFSNLWTHIVYVPLQKAGLLLFYDATSGVGQFDQIDGRGDMFLKKRFTNWRTTWTKIIAGRFGRANLLFYDATNGLGEFYSVDTRGNFKGPIQAFTGWRSSWHSILTGNFSSGPNDGLLFYDQGAGVGEFHKVNNNAVPQLINLHTNWRKSWQHIVAGQFLQNASFDGLLFYEEGSGHTEFHSTDGHGGISQIDINPGNPWRLPWQAIHAGEFTPNIGLIGTSRLCGYDARDGVIRNLFLELSTIKTFIDLNGRWTDGSGRNAVISTEFISLRIDMSAFSRPAAHGSIIDASTITVTFPDDKTFTGTIQPPNRIRWSNGSSWTKV